MILKQVGFFKELDYGDKQGESIYDFISATPGLDEDKIINYLKSGIVFVVSPTVTQDVISKNEKYIDALKTLTDGVWEWPLDLVYYVREYHVALDKEFINHMKSNGWTIPNKDSIDLDSLI